MGETVIRRRSRSSCQRGRAARKQPLLARIRVENDRVGGRLRVFADGLRRDPDRAATAAAIIGGIEGIRQVRASSLTGRILVEYDPALDPASMISALRAALVQRPCRDEGRTSGREGQCQAGRPAPASAVAGRAASLAAGHTGMQLESARRKQSSLPWHAQDPEQLIVTLACRPDGGLTTSEARRRLLRHGRNRIEQRPPPSPLVVFRRQFESLPVGLLLGASAASLLTGGLADALVTLAVVGANAGLGFATESGSERIIRTMTGKRASTAVLVRDGEEQAVDQETIVPGDLLVLRPNTVVAADCRVLEAHQLMVNEALLTGESEPVEKIASMVCPPLAILAERSNMVHKGSFVISGTGKAVAVATGAATEVGKIAEVLRGVETPKTPLEKDLDSLGTKLALVSLAACGTFFVAGTLRGRSLASMFRSAIALAVAAVPEGLPATATTTLALGLHELRRRGVVVRRLEAVEGLGSLQVVCFDKTGTLTQNRMQLDRLHLGAGAQIVRPAVACTDAGVTSALRRLHEISILCSEIAFEGHDGCCITPVGSSTEAALAAGALDFGIDPEALRREWRLVDMQYRSETNRFMRSIHARDANNAPPSKLIAVKGDPYQVLEMCEAALDARGRPAPMTAVQRRAIAGTSDDLAGHGLRVLGFAFAEATTRQRRPSPLCWIGAAALKDPVAPGVPALIARLRAAGIRPVMITGDQASTAEAIASEIGLNGDRPLRVLDARGLDNIAPDVLAAIARRIDVFARVPPTRKLRIVEALQSSGQIVGMSGDGFNDAPALKAADIAIAVGMNSASAARDVADIIVAEGKLEALADGVEQGRTILSNIRKAVHFIISTNLSEILVLFAETMTANDQLETPLELLWLNLVTDFFPGLGLAMEPPERNVMRRPPRDVTKPLLSVRDLRNSAVESAVIAAAVIAAHRYGLSRYGPGPQTRAVTFLSLVMSQLTHALACRHDRFEALGGRKLFGNGRLNAALLGAGILQSATVLSPALQRLLGIGAPRLGDFTVATASALGAFAVNETLLAIRTAGRRED